MRELCYVRAESWNSSKREVHLLGNEDKHGKRGAATRQQLVKVWKTCVLWLQLSLEHMNQCLLIGLQ
jgi:hypothetical protein